MINDSKTIQSYMPICDSSFFHQQSATDRDDYIDIFIDNVEKSMRSNFDKYGSDIITDFGVGYDFDSVMHYPNNAFGIKQENGSLAITMAPKPKVTPRVLNFNLLSLLIHIIFFAQYAGVELGRGYGIGLSDKDVKKIQAMYKDICGNNTDTTDM